MSHHPSATALWLHADGMLDAEIAAHVEHCASCRARLLESRALDELLTTDVPLAEECRDRLLALPDRRRPGRLAAALAAAAVVLLAGALAVRSRPSDPHAPAASIEPPSRRELVVAALRAPAPVRRVALEAAGDRILVTLHRLARDPHARDANAAIERIGELGRRASLPVLLDALKREDRREHALVALGAIGDPSAAERIAPFLADPALEPAAREALAASGGDVAVRALVAHVERVSDAAALVTRIGRMRGAPAALALADLLASPTLGATALAALDEGRHLSALLDAAGRGDEVALVALERLASPDAVPTLRRLLDDPGHRARAARVLAAIDTAEAGAALLEHVAVDDVREAFAHAGVGIEAWLLASARDGDWRAKRTAIDLLARCGSDAAIETLHELASDHGLAPHAVETLGRIGGSAAVAVLESLASQSALRRAAVDALGATGSRAAVDALVRLGTTDRALRRDVIAALGRIPHAEAVRAILTLDGSRRTRRTTTHALRAMDRETVVPVLTAMLDGDHAAEAQRWLDAVHAGRYRQSP